MYLYLLLHLIIISYPLANSFERRITFYKNFIYIFPAIAITALFFLIWDVVFTKMGVWGFNDDYTIGLYFLGLPLEEWLFFITVPFATIFIYECVKYFFKNEINPRVSKNILLFLALVLFILALIYSHNYYTFYNFLFTSVFLIISYFYLESRFIEKFLITYLFHIIPFLLINGVLTGSFIENPVVWYNNNENLGIRIFTIPVEDTIYSMLLLIMNIFAYEKLKSAKTIKVSKSFS